MGGFSLGYEMFRRAGQKQLDSGNLPQAEFNRLDPIWKEKFGYNPEDASLYNPGKTVGEAYGTPPSVNSATAPALINAAEPGDALNSGNADPLNKRKKTGSATSLNLLGSGGSQKTLLGE